MIVDVRIVVISPMIPYFGIRAKARIVPIMELRMDSFRLMSVLPCPFRRFSELKCPKAVNKNRIMYNERYVGVS